MEELVNPSKKFQILSVKKVKEGSYRLDRCFVSNTSEDMLQPKKKKKTQNTTQKKRFSLVALWCIQTGILFRTKKKGYCVYVEQSEVMQFSMTQRMKST